MTYTDEEIINALNTCADESEDCANCPFRTDIESCNDLIKISLAIIKRQRSELEKRQWISVNDRLPDPDDDKDVLILVKETEHYGQHKEKTKVYWFTYLAYWDGDEWYTVWCNGCKKISETAAEPYADEYEVTHWMPLPESPKGV